MIETKFTLPGLKIKRMKILNGSVENTLYIECTGTRSATNIILTEVHRYKGPCTIFICYDEIDEFEKIILLAIAEARERINHKFES